MMPTPIKTATPPMTPTTMPMMEAAWREEEEEAGAGVVVKPRMGGGWLAGCEGEVVGGRGRER
jgi:hypothetical protein